MDFISQHLLDSWVTVQIHVIVDALNSLLIYVMLRVLIVAGFLESEPVNLAALAIEYDALVQGLVRDHVLQAPHNLEFVLVNLLHMSNSGHAEAILMVVLADERAHHLVELEFVEVRQVHLVQLLERHHSVRQHHVGKRLCNGRRISRCHIV